MLGAERLLGNEKRPDHEVVFDGADALRFLRNQSHSSALGIRADQAPKFDRPIMHDDIDR